MKYRLPLIVLIGAVGVVAAAAGYKSPSPSRTDVQQVRAEIEASNPHRQSLTLAQATSLATAIFNTMAEDAARICRSVSAADSCEVPEFEVQDVAHVNARAGFDRQNVPTISLTRGLIEQLGDKPDELALLLGHEYGHLITAHVRQSKPSDGTADTVMGMALSVLAAAAAGGAGVSANGSYDRRSSGPVYSRREIDEYLQNGADSEAYRWFSKGQEIEADYIGTYLASRSGYAPTGSALVELGALKLRDDLSALEKQDRKLIFAYWDTHPHSPKRAARIQETLEEIEMLRSKGYARPIPPRLILHITDNYEAFHSLEELVAPLP